MKEVTANLMHPMKKEPKEESLQQNFGDKFFSECPMEEHGLVVNEA